ncbi:MAG: acyltransferase [Saprospiraceae bacterium]|nr:acyltransferase [Saprospiraceae bacterium]
MRLVNKSFFYKTCSVIRYYVMCLYHYNRFRGSAMSMVGRKNAIYLEKGSSMKWGGRVILNDHNFIQVKGHLQIGGGFGMNSFGRIVAHDNISIGTHVTIGQMVAILDHDHDYRLINDKLQLEGYITAPIRIGNNVWIGDKCTILKGVNIGDNVVIGAHSLVNKDVPSNSIVGGVPAKVLRSIPEISR